MNKNLLPIMLCVFSLNVFSEQNNQMYTLHQNNLFKNDSVIQNKNLTLSTKQIGKFSSFYLDNGLKVILLPFENIEKTGVYLTSRVGSKHEGYGETGMAHLLEHMLFKNTHNISDIKKELTNLGAEWNGFTSPEQTTFHEVFNNDKDNNKLNKILELESERFFNATFTKDDLDKEMSVVRNELERNESSPETLLWNETLNKSFDWHGYKHPTIGEKSDIENAPFYKLQDFYKKYYQPKNSFLIVFGNFNSSDIKPLIEKHFNKYQNINNHILNNWTQEPFSAKNSITTLYTSDNINASNIVWKAPNFIYDNRAVSASLVFSSISQKPYGIFYKKYILKKDKNTNFITDIDTSILPLNDYAPFIVQVEQVVEGNKFPQKNIDLITTDIESLSLFNQTNFNQLKEDILKKYKELESSPQSMVNSFLKYESMGDWSLYFSNKELVKNSSFDDGIDYLKEYITPYNRTVVNIMKDSKLKNNSYYKNIKTLNQTHYNNQKIDYINETKEKPVDFTFESIPTFEPSLENLKNNTQHISFSNKNIEIKTAFIKKQTLGDYVYFSLSNKFGNTLLNTKYRDNCSLLGIVPALGGTNYSREELDKIMKKYEATYSLNFNSISLKVKKEYFIETLNILFDVLKNPSFDELEFESIKKSNINSLESNLSNQNVLNSEFLIKKITPYDINSPLFKLSSKETLEVLKKHTVNDLKMCYNIFKGATNTNISILGNVSKEDIEKSLQSYYSWTPNYIYNMVENSKIKDFNTILKENNNESTFILHDTDKPNSFNIKLVQLPIDITNPDYPKLKAAISIFGDSSNSRLFKSLREKNGLSYTATANISGNYFFKKTPLSIYVISSVNNADKANKLIQDTWSEFLTKGITEDELINFKENIINAKKLSLSEDLNLVNFNLDRISNNKDIQFYIDFYDQINNLTVDDINISIKKWLKDIMFITVYNK